MLLTQKMKVDKLTSVERYVWATRKKLDGRCDYRKYVVLPCTKRSFSLHGSGQERWVTSTTSTSALYGCGSWQADNRPWLATLFKRSLPSLNKGAC